MPGEMLKPPLIVGKPVDGGSDRTDLGYNFGIELVREEKKENEIRRGFLNALEQHPVHLVASKICFVLIERKELRLDSVKALESVPEVCVFKRVPTRALLIVPPKGTKQDPQLMPPTKRA